MLYSRSHIHPFTRLETPTVWLVDVPLSSHLSHSVFCSGRREDFSHRDFQAADQGGGRLGTDQRTVGTHHLLNAHRHRHGRRLRDAKENEFATGAVGFETLVKKKKKTLGSRWCMNHIPFLSLRLLCKNTGWGKNLI